MNAELAHLLQTYGYAAVFLGTLLEGETLILMAGFAAHQGYLHLPFVVTVAAAGGLLGDQFLFFLGRTRGRQILARYPSLQVPAERALHLLDRYQTPIVFGIRFMYGLRTAGPLAIGMSDVPAPRFIVLNALGAAVWALLFSLIGYAFGHAAETLLGDLQRYEKLALAGVAAIGIAVAIVRWMRRRRSNAQAVLAREGKG